MRTATLDGAILFVVAALLIWPLFQIEYLDNWMSIDGAFIGDARALSEQLPNPGWTPNYYCGNRFDYLYPPAMRYSSALLSRYGGISAAHGYHLYSALMYCLGIAGLYALLRVAGWCRRWSVATAAATLVLSPVLLLFSPIRQDSALRMPQKLNVLVKWGEVPHVSSLGLLLFALAAAWLALRDGDRRMLGLAALLSALCVSTNFYGAAALAVFFSLLVWSLWLGHGGSAILARALGIAALSYGLTAFWLTPSYLRLTVTNLKLVAPPSDRLAQGLMLLLLVVFAALSYWLAHHKPDRVRLVFLMGATAIFALSGLGFYYFQLQTVGDPKRFIPELDLLLILGAAEGLRRGVLPLRIAGGAVLAASLVLALPYVRNPWGVCVVDHHPEKRIEYRLSAWLSTNLPGSRVFTVSSLGFWANAWNDIRQVSGISDQGLQNPIIPLINWQILNGEKPSRDLSWLQAVGADAIVVHGKRSQEVYHAIRSEGKYAGRLEVLFDSGEDDRVYRVPRRYASWARVVNRQRMAALSAIPWTDENEPELNAYVEALEQGPPTTTYWSSSRELKIAAQVAEGEAVVVQVSYDPSWHASSNGQPLPIHKDILGFMLIDAPPGNHEIEMVFRTPFENKAGRLVTLLALGVTLGFLFQRKGGSSGRSIQRSSD